MAVYAVSDLHGQYDIFIEGLERIGFGESDELYMIGDAIDRGPDGIRILQYVKDHKNMDLLIGNHEFMMMNSVDSNGYDECSGPDWLIWLYGNGGDRTFDQYCRLELRERQSLLLWLRRRYVMKTMDVGGRSFCLTHSYFLEGLENKTYDEMSYEDIWNIVWKSVYREDEDTCGQDIYGNYDYIFITGHVPVIRIMRELPGHSDFNELSLFRKGNFIDIDGGCAAGRHEGINNGAIFLRLDDMEAFPIKF